MAIANRPLCWDIYEEHLDEAAWLWGEWEQALDSPLYALADVAAGPEERLLAHLDGLVLGGEPVARRLLLPALTSDDPGAVCAAAWALLQSEDADHQDAIVELLGSAPPPVQAAIGRAFGLASRADISRLLGAWHEGPPRVRSMVFDLFGSREPQWVRERLDGAFRSGQAELVAAALRAVRRTRDRDFLDHVRFALPYPDPAVQAEVMTTGLVLGIKETWATCRAAAASAGPNCRLALALLAVGPDPKDRELVRSRVADPELGRDALWALGFAADMNAVDTLVQAMANPETARLAGEGFATITGVPVAGALAKPGETVGPEMPEVGPDDPPPITRSEDLLPEPDPDAVAAYWAKERSRFHPVIRYVGGQPRSSEALRAALTDSATWRRPILATELTMSVVSAPQIELRDFAKRQLAQLAQIPKVVTMDRKALAMHQQTLRS